MQAKCSFRVQHDIVMWCSSTFCESVRELIHLRWAYAIRYLNAHPFRRPKRKERRRGQKLISKINKQTINPNNRKIYWKMCICGFSSANIAFSLSHSLSLAISAALSPLNALIIYLQSTPADSIYIIAQQAEVHYIVCEYNWLHRNVKFLVSINAAWCWELH